MFLITTDTHFTEAPQDAYRFDLFPFLIEQTLKLKAKYIFILGDLTDKKDNHPASLVNRLTEELQGLVEETGAEVFILRGNHDCIDPDEPFFGFANSFEGITFITQPWETKLGGKKILFLPHSRQPEKDWADVKFNGDFVFLHQTINGAVASNGQKMEGDVGKRIFTDIKGTMYSGDIHVPQKLGGLVYIGSPYRIRFGDNFEPRVVYLEARGTTKDLHLDTIRKHVVRISNPDRLKAHKELERGDQVKIRVQLPRSEFHEWGSYKRRAREVAEGMGLFVHGVELEEKPTRPNLKKDEETGADRDANLLGRGPRAILDEYCEREKVGNRTKGAGVALLER